MTHPDPAGPASAGQQAGAAIRLATTADAVAISALVTRLTRQYVLPDQPQAAAVRLIGWMAASAIAERIDLGDRHHVAEIDGVLVGVVATRDNSHMHLLFVDTCYQRRGIARALWRVARDACIEAGHSGPISVNASAFAVPTYLRFGFVALGPQETHEGIVTTPLEYRSIPGLERD